MRIHRQIDEARRLSSAARSIGGHAGEKRSRSPFGRARLMQAAALIALTLSSASSCRPEHRPEEIPLRPLLHTEPREGTTLPEGFGLWTSDIDPVAWPSRFLSSAAVTSGSLNLMQATTPDRLVLDAYYALVNGEEDRLMRHLFSPEELSAAARMGSDTALTSSEAIASEVAALYAAFNSGPV
ncbi:MAG: hypothetical protein ACJA1R_001216, partial [Flavobacteriales bacterium]